MSMTWIDIVVNVGFNGEKSSNSRQRNWSAFIGTSAREAVEVQGVGSTSGSIMDAIYSRRGIDIG